MSSPDNADDRLYVRPWFLVAAVIVLSLLSAWLLADNRTGAADLAEFKGFLGTAGSIATLLAVVAAGVFASLSNRHLRRVAARVEEIGGPLSVHQAAESPPGDDVDTPAGDQGTFVVPDEQGQPIEFARLATEDVPLRVWTALVNSWERDGEDGRWTGADVSGVVRRTGRGNFPWIISFRPEPGFVHSVVYGGRAKKAPTVKRFEMPGFLDGELGT